MRGGWYVLKDIWHQKTSFFMLPG
ncbi:hypothetical protein NC652_032013 [Populus alba x Populus x berolinensis]|nr:hypothetical protein NC652_032013 [Populus alba x Populus x berolinensis]